jgi:hypothetical protein
LGLPTTVSTHLRVLAGIAQKVALAAMFLRCRQQKFVKLKADVDKLQLVVGGDVKEISL